MSNKEKKVAPEKTKEEIITEELGNFFQKEIIDKIGLIVKQAILIGSKRVNYFRGKDFVILFKENYDYIKGRIKEITTINIGNEYTDKSIREFFQIYFDRKLLLKIIKNEGDKAKYPKNVTIPKSNQWEFEENKYYLINIKNEPSKKPIIYLILLIVIIILGCMFPIWPLKAKIGFLWGIIYILVALIILLVLCIIVPFIALIFGYDAMLLPNLFEPHKGRNTWKERFFPILEYEKLEFSWINLIFRIIIGLFFLLIIASVILYPNFYRYAYVSIKNGLNYLFSLLSKKLIEKRNQVSVVDPHFDIINNDVL